MNGKDVAVARLSELKDGEMHKSYDGDLGGKDFLAFYIKAGNIVAVAGMNRDRELDIWEEKFRAGETSSRSLAA